MTDSRTTKFGVAIPQKFPDGVVDTRYIGEFLIRLEELGYDSAWVGEGVFSRVPNLEPFPLLSYAAALTSRVKLGVSALTSAFWNPIFLAKAVASLDQLSNGRFILGVTVGVHREHYPAFGMKPEDRLTRFVEGLALMKELWTKESVTFKGKFWDMEEVSISPRPAQKPHPPVWFGSRALPALRRSVKSGDGWMGSGATSTEEFREHVRILRGFMEEEGKSQAQFPLSKRVYLALDSDRPRALRRLEEMMGFIYGDPTLASKVAVYGDREEVAEGLREVMAEGIDLVLLAPAFDPKEQAELLAEQVLPRL